MKKNVLTKIVLAFVLAMLVFALVACNGVGNKNNNNDDNGNNNNNKECTEHVDEDEDGKCDVCDADMPETPAKDDFIGKVVGIIENATPLVDTFKSIKADSTVGIDAAVGAYFVMDGSKHGFNLNLAANASKEDPELALNVSVDEKDYFGLGYSAANLYLLEGLNLINTNEKDSNKIKMDASALEDGVLNAIGVAMDALVGLAQSEGVQSFDFDSLPDMIKGLLGSFEATIKELLEISGDDKGAKLVVKSESVKALLDPEEGMIGLLVKDYASMLEKVDKVLSTLNIQIEGKPLTVNAIFQEYLPTITVEIGYNADKAIDAIDVYVEIEKLDFKAGVAIDLPLFSTTKKADIDFDDYVEQDLKTNVTVDLPIKGVNACLDVILHTSDAFAKDGNAMATAVLDINGNKSEAVFNGKDLYIDFENAFKAVKLDAAANGVEAKYTYSLNASVIEVINGLLNGIGAESAVNAAADDSDSGIWTMVYNMAAGIFGETAKATATQEDCVKLLYNNIGAYVTFIKATDTSFAQVGANLIALWTANKDLLLNSLHTSEAGDINLRAGVQLLDVNEDGNTIDGGLIKFVAKFIKIPKITAEGIDVNTPVELTTVQEIVDYIELAFAQYQGGRPEINSQMIQKILGVTSGTLNDLLAEGLYIGVGTTKGEGLYGYIELKTAFDSKTTYVKVAGSISFEEDTTAYDVDMPDDLTSINSIDRVYDAPVNGFNYYITNALYTLFRGFLAYIPA